MRARLAVVCSLATAALLVSALSAAGSRPRLVAHGGIHRPLVIKACRSTHRCEEWARYSGEPPRAVVETGFSRSGRYFYVWSRADGRPRDLDIYRVPRRGHRAHRTAHMTPGFGGDLHWLDGDFLWHAWGCGTSCDNGNLYSTAGKVVLSEPVVSADSVAPDGHRVAVVDFGGRVVLIEAGRSGAVRYEYRSKTHLGFPQDVTWHKHGLRVAFDGATLDCAAKSGKLACTKR